MGTGPYPDAPRPATDRGKPAGRANQPCFPAESPETLMTGNRPPGNRPIGNRLSGETSPYLLQHKDNPVHWRPWGAEALQAAKEADKPILLSVGYAACHWCHVMAHESFENPDIAELMNENFVNIKVDREERPDIDAIYMNAVQMMTHHG